MDWSVARPFPAVVTGRDAGALAGVEELENRLDDALRDNALLSALVAKETHGVAPGVGHRTVSSTQLAHTPSLTARQRHEVIEMVRRQTALRLTLEADFDEKIRGLQAERDEAVAEVARIEEMRLQDNKEAAKEMERALAAWEADRSEMLREKSLLGNGAHGQNSKSSPTVHLPAAGSGSHLGLDKLELEEYKGETDTYMHRANKIHGSSSYNSCLQERAPSATSELRDKLAEEVSLLAEAGEVDQQLGDRLWSVLAINRALEEAFEKIKAQKQVVSTETDGALAQSRTLQAELTAITSQLQDVERQRDEATARWQSLHDTQVDAMTNLKLENARCDAARGDLQQEYTVWATRVACKAQSKRQKRLALQRWRQYARRRAMLWRRAQIIGYRFYRWHSAILQHAFSNWFLVVRRKTRSRRWFRRLEGIIHRKRQRGTMMSTMVHWDRVNKSKDAAVTSLRLKNLARFVQQEARLRVYRLQLVCFRTWHFTMETQPHISMDALLENQAAMQTLFERKCRLARRRGSCRNVIIKWKKWSGRQTAASHKLAIFLTRGIRKCVKLRFRCWQDKSRHSRHESNMLSMRLIRCILFLIRRSLNHWLAFRRQSRRKRRQEAAALRSLAGKRRDLARSCFEEWQDFLFEQTRLVVVRRARVGSFAASALAASGTVQSPGSPHRRPELLYDGYPVTVSHLSSPEWTDTSRSPRDRRCVFFRDWRDHVHHHIRRTAAAHAGVPKIHNIFGPVFPKQHSPPARVKSLRSSSPTSLTSTSFEQAEQQTLWPQVAHRRATPVVDDKLETLRLAEQRHMMQIQARARAATASPGGSDRTELTAMELGSHRAENRRMQSPQATVEKRQKTFAAGGMRKGIGAGAWGDTQSLRADMLMEQECMTEFVLKSLQGSDKSL